MSGAKIILLCEDTQTDSFVRRFLKHRNFTNHDITTLLPKPGSGSGEQWVREQYPKELKAIRSKRNAYLIVVIDADTHTIDDRHKELEKECRENRIRPRDHRRDANVLHIIPRRNIETWLAYLENKNVDEFTIYRKLKKKSDCKIHAENLYNMCHCNQGLREPVPPALREACNEYRKLKRNDRA